MKQNDFTYKLCVGWMLVILINIPIFGQTPDQIYNNGRRAFNENKYLDAVKYLYAYQQMLKNQISPELNNSINSAIDYCDDQINLAIRTKEELEKNGVVTEIVVESSGKADDPNKTKKTVKFNQPKSTHQQKPNLPNNSTSYNKSDNTVESKTDKVSSKEAEYKIQNQNLINEITKIRSAYNEQTEEYKLLNEKYTNLYSQYKKLKDTKDSSSDSINNSLKETIKYDVILESVGNNKISVIKIVREFTGLGLKEAKDLVDSAPKPVKEGVSKEEAERLKKELEKAGAVVELK